MFPPLSGAASDGMFIHQSSSLHSGRLSGSNSQHDPATSPSHMSMKAVTALGAIENVDVGDPSVSPPPISDLDFF